MPKGPRVTAEQIGQMAKTISGLEPRPPKDYSIQQSVSEMSVQIDEMLGPKGYSVEDLVEVFAAVGITIGRRTLSQYVSAHVTGDRRRRGSKKTNSGQKIPDTSGWREPRRGYRRCGRPAWIWCWCWCQRLSFDRSPCGGCAGRPAHGPGPA